MLVMQGSGESSLVARCVHCGGDVGDADSGVTPNVRCLRDHLLGCPDALVACQPALPIFHDRDELLEQFVFERLSRRRENARDGGENLPRPRVGRSPYKSRISPGVAL